MIKATKTNPRVTQTIPIFLASTVLLAALIVLMTSRYSKKVDVVKAPLRAVVIPHHLIARTAIEKTLGIALDAEPSLVVLITPNHFEKGSRPVVVTQRSIKPGHTTHHQLVTELISSGIASVDEEAVVGEHAINDTVNLILKTNPQQNIISLMVSNRISEIQLDELVSILTKFYKSNEVLPIYSVDFSHGLHPTEATKRDQETLALVESNSYSSIRKLDNSYLDAPPVLITALKTAESLEWRRELLWHSDAVAVTHSTANRTVTYFIFGFYRT